MMPDVTGISAKLDEILRRLEAHSIMFYAIDRRLGDLERRIDRLEARMDRLESRFGDMERRLAHLEEAVHGLGAKVQYLLILHENGATHPTEHRRPRGAAAP